MEIGDTYISNNWKYEVIGRDGEGRIISKRLGKADAEDNSGLPFVEVKDTKPAILEEENKDEQFTKTDINRMSVSKLTTLCEELGIEPSTGSEMKKKIIAKLGL